MKRAQQIIKELTKLVAQLDELLVRIISAVGWLIFLSEILH